jgi:hypothetical protein
MEIKDKEPLWYIVHGLTHVVPTNLFTFFVCCQNNTIKTSILTLESNKKSIKLDQNFINWLAGFSDAEANFNISLKGLQGNKYNSLNLTFQIDLHKNDLHVLEHIKDKLNCGSISKSGDKCNYFVNDQKSLINVILPIFNYVELKSSKYFQFLVFKKAVDLLTDKNHLTPKGRIEILQYYQDMKIVNQNAIARKNMEIDKYWLIGFTEGDGCFAANKLKPKLRYENHIKELELFNSILSYLNNGNLYVSNRKYTGFVSLEINNINVLMNVILPMFSEGMLTKKSLDFTDWSIIVKITYYGYHTLSEGKELIHLIKSKINSFRFKPDSILADCENKDLVQEKLKNLFSLPSPYEVKNGIIFLRGTDKLVSKNFKIKIEHTNGKVLYLSSISQCSLNLDIPSKIIKNCLITGDPYKDYIFKFDSYIK